MSYGAVGNSEYVLDEELIKQNCPDAYNKFYVSLNEEEFSEEQFASVAVYDFENIEDLSFYDNEDCTTVKAYRHLCKDFKEKTGLTIGMNYHDGANAGDCYDEVNGVFWWVDGVVAITEAGEKYKQWWARKNWVVFG